MTLKVDCKGLYFYISWDDHGSLWSLPAAFFRITIMGDVLTTQEVADICNVHRATIVRWINEGELAAQQTLGGRYRVRRSELERLAAERDLSLADIVAPSGADTVGREEEATEFSTAAVLVVDDDPGIRALMLHAFFTTGVKVAAVDTGYAALDAVLKHRSIRIVVLDLHLPGLDGIDTILEMRRIRPDLKIIVISGALRYFDSDQVQSLSDAQLEKPFSMGALVALCCSLGMQESTDSQALPRLD
jgi:excisionase family DNA binding protein